MRKIEKLSADWQFRLDTYKEWQSVTVPHDWAIYGPFDRTNDLYSTRIVQNGETTETVHSGRTGGLPHIGTGWYRREINLSAADKGKCIFLEFDGIMSRSTVFVNGAEAGSRPYGYSSFQLDITELVHFDRPNIIEVKVNNPGQSSRWYPGAGIYREARLVITEKEHFNYSSIWITGHEVKLDYTGEDCQTALSVLDMENNEVFQTVISGKEGTFKIDNPALWSPENPALYTFNFTLMKNGEVKDTKSIRYGFRTVSFDSKQGMTLNGKPYYLKGVCLHHDLGPLGTAFSLPAEKRRLKLLKSIGCNAIRTTHNPADPKLLDLCDEMGFIVIEESFDAWAEGKIANDYSSLYHQWHERDLTDMIKRDRNHPAIVMWSVGNEVHEQWHPDGWKISAELVALCHQTDPTRPVTAGLSAVEVVNTPLPETLDIIGWNYKPRRYTEFQVLYPDKPTYGSETASTVSSRGEYFFPVESGPEWRFHDNNQCSSYDMEFPLWASTPDTEFAMQDANPGIFGEFVWTGFDYLGEPTPYDNHWPSHASYFGIFDLAGLPKDRAWLYSARWTDKPVLHILPHWNWPDREGKVTPVHVYTNFSKVELFVNGESAGIRHREKSAYRLIWDDVVYTPGKVEAVALDENGKELARSEVKTLSAPAEIRLESDRMTLNADGEDLAFVTVSITDSEGNVHPHAGDNMTFEVTGKGVFAAAANGNSASTELFHSGQMSVFHGQCVAIVRSGNEAGEVRLTVSAEGLEKAEIVLNVH